MRTYFVYSCMACGINLEFFPGDRQAWIDTRGTHRPKCCVKIELRENTLLKLKEEDSKKLDSNPFFKSELHEKVYFFQEDENGRRQILERNHYIRLYTDQDRQKWNELFRKKHQEIMPQKLELWEAMRKTNAALSLLQTTEGDAPVSDHKHHSSEPDPTVDYEAGAHVGEFRD